MNAPSAALQVRESGRPGAPAIVFLHATGASAGMWEQHRDRPARCDEQRTVGENVCPWVLGNVCGAFGHPVRHWCLCHQTWPASGSSTPSMMRMAVVLPAPLGPDEPEHLPLDDGE